jgi:putative Ca2+/H+ antiporter (TMEM165/GDT1 family)
VRELALYLAAGAVYVAVGVAVPELLFSWIEGAAFLLVAVWLLPALLGRFR